MSSLAFVGFVGLALWAVVGFSIRDAVFTGFSLFFAMVVASSLFAKKTERETGNAGFRRLQLATATAASEATVAVRPFLRGRKGLFLFLMLEILALLLWGQSGADVWEWACMLIFLASFTTWSVENRLTLTPSAVLCETRVLETRITRQLHWSELLPLSELVNATAERRWLVWHGLRIVRRDGIDFRVSVGRRDDAQEIAKWLTAHIVKCQSQTAMSQEPGTP